MPAPVTLPFSVPPPARLSVAPPVIAAVPAGRSVKLPLKVNTSAFSVSVPPASSTLPVQPPPVPMVSAPEVMSSVAAASLPAMPSIAAVVANVMVSASVPPKPASEPAFGRPFCQLLCVLQLPLVPIQLSSVPDIAHPCR